MPELDSCNCCKGLSPETPVELYNRPGLNAIAYRVGTYTEFRESLLSRLSASDLPSLNQLRTRNDDDFTIALLDAWAVVSDVFTFYQERIANENYLRTATERFSVLQMARLIGYELKPGVAATTYLAFSLDKTAGTPVSISDTSVTGDTTFLTSSITIDEGVKVQSIPGPGEQQQTFETVEAIEARPEWNTIRPRISYPQSADDKNDFFILNGIISDLKKGDVLLIGQSFIKKIKKVTQNISAGITRIDVSDTNWKPSFPADTAVADGDINTLSGVTELTDTVISTLLNKTWKEEDLGVLLEMNEWVVNDVLKAVREKLEDIEAPVENALCVFRKTAAPFGYNATLKLAYNTDGTLKSPSAWDEWDLSSTEKCNTIYLDSEYKEILQDSYVAVQPLGDPLGSSKIFQIDKVEVGTRTDYGLSSKTTFLEIDLGAETCWYNNSSGKLSALRGVGLHIQSENLELADLPSKIIVQGDTIALDRWYPGLKADQKVILIGERHDPKGTMTSEVMTLAEVWVKQGYTVIRFTESLANTYIRSSVMINANVALATHGETVTETLGSGDATKPFQQFVLKQTPLTYLSSSSATGTETTLKVYVNDILWHETDSFFDHLPNERIYITRLDNDGKTTVTFGDGITGLRPPTGVENITAVYRKGIGLGGLVKANQLSQLLTKPLGVKAAINPLASGGAADPEDLSDARTNAPLPLLTLGRIVSLQDYEDFSRAFAGIGKSLATWTWRKSRRCIFLTIAGAEGATIAKTDTLYEQLTDALLSLGDPRVHIIVEPYRSVFFRVEINIKVHPDYLPEKVIPEVETRLRDTFSFAGRSFGQPVSLSEVYTVCQQTEGVVAVDIDKLYYATSTAAKNDLLKARIPETGNDDTMIPAELLTLDPGPVVINIMS